MITKRAAVLSLSVDLNHTGVYLAPVFENNLPFRLADLKFAGYTKADVFLSLERRLSERVAAVLFAGADNLLIRNTSRVVFERQE